MEILFLLIPIAVVMAAIAIAAFIFSVRSGQYEDMEGPGHRILMDDDDPLIPEYHPKRKAKSLPEEE